MSLATLPWHHRSARTKTRSARWATALHHVTPLKELSLSRIPKKTRKPHLELKTELQRGYVEAPELLACCGGQVIGLFRGRKADRATLTP